MPDNYGMQTPHNSYAELTIYNNRKIIISFRKQWNKMAAILVIMSYQDGDRLVLTKSNQDGGPTGNKVV